MSKLTYSQKPSSFHQENEFRFVFIKENDSKEFITIPLSQPYSKCRIIN